MKSLPTFISAPRVRGISVPHRKHTDDSATAAITPPGEVVIPLSMHIGRPAEALVKPGDRVFVGTLIAKATGFISANTHSSVSGTVKALREITASDGSAAACAVIESDGLFEPDPGIRPPAVTDRQSLMDAVQASGLVGLGGAGFPTHVKLAAPAEGKPPLDILVINAAECEPYITSDNRTMLEDWEDLKAGIEAVMRHCGLRRAVIGIERNKPRAIEKMRELFPEKGDVEVLPLRCSYPQGAEKVLIANATGRAVPMGGLPADAGVVVLNVTSAAFIGSYLRTGTPLVSKRVTVDGGAVLNPGNYRVPIGTPISHLLSEVGWEPERAEKLLMGGPMMGTALYTADYPLLKNNNAILALTSEELGVYRIDPCIRCGRCADNCPMGLSPVEIALALEQKDLTRMRNLFAMNCIECGSCSFVCPAKRPVTQTMRLAKGSIRKAGGR